MKQSSSTSGLPNLVKRGKWLLLILWIIVLVTAFPFIGKLNDSLTGVASLPANDQAQIVHNIMQKADPNASQEDMSVVYENKSGITAQDRQVIASQREQIAQVQLKNITTISPVAYSTDGRAAYFSLLANVPSSNKTGPPIEKSIVTKVRQIVQSSKDLTASTTGQIAFNVDSNSANADTILLLSAAVIVAVLLILTYRSALLWIVPLISAILAISLADAVVYALTRHGVQASSLDSSILIVLVFGVATDYGMLLVSRYREYLHTHADKNEAVALAVKASFGAIAASASTVALALLALVFAALKNTKDLGPIAAIGIVCAFLVQMTFLPAILAIGGRALLWPRAPKFVPDTENKEYIGSRLWTTIGRVVARYPRRITIGVTLGLLVCAIGITQLKLTVNPSAILRGNPPSVQGQNILEQHFTAISNAPVVITANSVPSIQKAKQLAESNSGTGAVSAITILAGHPSISIIPKATPYSNAAFSYIADLRTNYKQAGLHDVNVGGQQATQSDMSRLDKWDNVVLMPIILLIVGVVLVILLRSIVAPIMLLMTVILSFAASFGLSVLIFQHLFHFQGMDPALPLYIFLFVVALGVDYNIFLMERARQESTKHGTHEGMLHALRVTGGVITAAGLVLAGTFTALAQLPIITLTEVGVAVALGVLIDSFLVRSFLVPAAVLTVGPKTWWPKKFRS